MKKNKLLDNTKALIVRDFELAINDDNVVTEEDLLRILADRTDDLIQHRIEYLFSLMYRLDVDEGKVHYALSPVATEPANVALARLVLEREKKRAFTKMHYKQNKIKGMEW